MMNKLRNMQIDRWLATALVLATALGLIIGLALAWTVWPVEYVLADGLIYVDGQFYIVLVSEHFAYSRSTEMAATAVSDGADGAAGALCLLLANEQSLPQATRLAALAAVAGVECGGDVR